MKVLVPLNFSVLLATAFVIIAIIPERQVLKYIHKTKNVRYYQNNGNNVQLWLFYSEINLWIFEKGHDLRLLQ